MRSLLIDNYDSYTYNLFQLMAMTFGVPPKVLTNDSAEWNHINFREYDAIVVSPGPGHPRNARDIGACHEVLRHTELPVLGVCLGHQLLALLSGADVVPAPMPRHGYPERVWHNERDLFEGIPQSFTAVRYHSLCVSLCIAGDLPDCVEVTAYADDGVIMGLRHRDRPWWGVQFHPESVGTKHGERIMRNFANLVASRRWRLLATRIDREIDAECAFSGLFGESQHAFWLDSCGRSRFPFLGDAGGPHGEVLSGNAIFELLEDRLHARGVKAPDELPFDFAGGYVGYLGYELGSVSMLGPAGRHVPEEPLAQWMAASRGSE